ncbi:MAG: tetratricopeptide repeat protein [Candidatus Aminicenantales bacterium]
MKIAKKVFSVFLISTLGLLVLNTLSFQQTAGELFEKALYLEEAKGDLQKAIEIYEKILEQFPDNREVAARAQLHLGLCYEKLGLEKAEEAFQKVVNNYPEQKEVVKIAKEKLSIILKAQALAEKGEKEFKIRKVCEGSDVDVSGEVSPDGRYISGTDWRTGDLAIYKIATGKMRLLTGPTKETPIVLRSLWSPDSRRIAYNWDMSELRIIGLDGSEPRVLYQDEGVLPYPADWSPDGRHILAILENYYKDNIKQVGLISVADGTVNILETLKGRDVWHLSFSPDGRYIAYDYPQKKGSQGHDIFIYSIEEKREIPLVQHLANDCLGDWTPDGKRILFSSNRLGTMDLWAIAVEEGKPQGSPTLVKKDIGLVSPLGFAPDGSFYYGVGIKIADIYIGTMDEGREKFIVPPEKLESSFVGRNFSPEWSPDGTSLAYMSKRHHGASSLYIYSLENGEEREVVRPLEIQPFGDVSMGLCWSPDGRSILTSGGEKKGQGVYVVDVETGEMTTVLYGEPLFYGETRIMFPKWSADGKAIFFVERHWKKGISRIFRYDMKTKEKKEIYNQRPHLMWLIPSPDGKLLAFMTHKKHEGDYIGVLMTLPVEGGEPREVAKIIGAGEGSWVIAWTPDSRDIIYGKDLRAPDSRQLAQSCELWKVSIDEGKPRRLWEKRGSLKFLSVHPDGQRVAFSSGTWQVEIWVMENFLSEEKK